MKAESNKPIRLELVWRDNLSLCKTKSCDLTIQMKPFWQSGCMHGIINS